MAVPGRLHIAAMLSRWLASLLCAVLLITSPTMAATITFAAIGDYGDGSDDELEVANLVKSWSPDFIITLGDNNYPDGAASTMDARVGQYFREFIYPYKGEFGPGAATNRFFPSLGNHDWTTPDAQPYLDYFTLPGNERYYNFVWGPVHFFVLDSDSREPDGAEAGSVQFEWLQQRMAAATAPWRIVYFHHTPYSSGGRETVRMRWPFREWGAHAVLAAHDHTYERLSVDGFPYFVNGLGGAAIYDFATPVPESVVRYNADHGAMKIVASESHVTFQFIARTGDVIDTQTITRLTAPPIPPSALTAVLVAPDAVRLSWKDNAFNDEAQEVQRSTDGASYTSLATLGPYATAFEDDGLLPGQTYYYRVLARNDFGVGVSQPTCITVPFSPLGLTLADATRALAISAGLIVADAEEHRRLDVIACAETLGQVDLLDALWIARQALITPDG